MKSDDGLTARELAGRTNHSIKWVRNRLAALLAEGRLVVGARAIVRIDGVSCRVPVYRIKQK